MLKLCFTVIIGTFIIYGLDELKVISADDFTYKEKPKTEDVLSNTHNEKENMKFTDRIVQKRLKMKERVKG